LVPVLADVLAAKAPGAPVTVVEADAMALDWAALLGAGPDWALVANLPYNVATPLVADLLDGVPAVQRMLVMVQREVGQRLVAAPGDRLTAPFRSRWPTGPRRRWSGQCHHRSSCLSPVSVRSWSA